MQGNFTKQFLQSLKAPSSGRLYVADTREKGLSVYVTSNGIITFFVRKRIHGRDERVVIGRYPEITVEQARTQALAIKAQVAQGKDPIEDKRRMRGDITFFDMFQEFMERYSKKQKRSWQYDEREVNKFLSHWFNLFLIVLSNGDGKAKTQRRVFVNFVKNHGIGFYSPMNCPAFFLP
jgi:hypothetical protein